MSLTPADRLVNAVIKKVKDSGLLWSGVLMGTVSAVNTDGTVTVTRGSDTYPSVRLLASVAPSVGDSVEIMRTMGGWVCLGVLAAADPNAWIPLTLASGWTQFSGNYPPFAGYRVTNGVVHLRGVVQHASFSTAQTICTLPAAIRPPYQRRFVTEIAKSTFAALDVNPDGTVVVQDMSSAGTWCSLDPAIYHLN